MTATTLWEALEDSARHRPDAVALTQDGNSMTHGDFMRAVSAVAARYAGLGIVPGDRIICQLPNGPEHLIALAAAWACRAVHVGADHQLTPTELAWLVEHTSAAALVYQPPPGTADLAGALRLLGERNPGTRILMFPVAQPPPDGPGGWIPLPEVFPPRPQGSGPEGVPPADPPRPEDPALILFTSGTTGTPKGTVGRHGDLVEGWRDLAADAGFGPDDAHLGQLPLSHGFGLSLAVMALITGGRLVLVDRFSATETLRLVGEERITVLNGTPSHFTILTRRLDPSRHDVSSLRMGVGSAAAFPPPLLRRIFDDLGMDLMLMYGSSEGVGVVTTDREEMLMGSVGRPIPGAVRIVGPDHRPLATGEIGEIAFNRDLAEIDYWAEPSADPPPNGAGSWYHSGDVGRLDEQGRLFVLGRIKHQVDRGGIKVDPGEVEQALMRVPGILDAAVTGLPDEVLGETVCACIVPEPGSAPSLEQLRGLLATELAPHKLPENLILIEAVPRTEIGKIDRTRLRTVAQALAGREARGPG